VKDSSGGIVDKMAGGTSVVTNARTSLQTSFQKLIDQFKEKRNCPDNNVKVSINKSQYFPGIFTIQAQDDAELLQKLKNFSDPDQTLAQKIFEGYQRSQESGAQKNSVFLEGNIFDAYLDKGVALAIGPVPDGPNGIQQFLSARIINGVSRNSISLLNKQSDAFQPGESYKNSNSISFPVTADTPRPSPFGSNYMVGASFGPANSLNCSRKLDLQFLGCQSTLASQIPDESFEDLTKCIEERVPIPEGSNYDGNMWGADISKRIKSIKVKGTASSRSNLSGTSRCTDYCAKDFVSLAYKRAEWVASQLETFLKATNTLNKNWNLPANYSFDKVEYMVFGEHGDGTAGPCAYSAPGTTNKRQEQVVPGDYSRYQSASVEVEIEGVSVGRQFSAGIMGVGIKLYCE
jgi:hypothetical protein